MSETDVIRAEINIARGLLSALWAAPVFDRAAVEAVNANLRGLLVKLNKLEPRPVDRRLKAHNGIVKRRQTVAAVLEGQSQ
jgi:hypothetical protein